MTDTTELVRLDYAQATTPAMLALRTELEHFFSVEAVLLDERRYEEWLDLFDENVRYYAPLVRNVPSDETADEWQVDPLSIAWFDEGKHTLTQRVTQLRTGEHWAEEPISRTTHCFSNLLVERVTPSVDTVDTVQVRCNIVVHRSRQEAERNTFVGSRRDTLRRADGGGWTILTRVIYLDEAVLNAKNLTTFL